MDKTVIKDAVAYVKDSFIGQTYQFKVIKFNKKRGNIVLSRRALLERQEQLVTVANGRGRVTRISGIPLG